MGEEWLKKSGRYGPGDDAVQERAERVRKSLFVIAESLENEERKDIVVVTHGVFMKFLTGDPDIDLPKAGWKVYAIEKRSEEKYVLVAQGD